MNSLSLSPRWHAINAVFVLPGVLPELTEPTVRSHGLTLLQWGDSRFIGKPYGSLALIWRDQFHLRRHALTCTRTCRQARLISAFSRVSSVIADLISSKTQPTTEMQWAQTGKETTGTGYHSVGQWKCRSCPKLTRTLWLYLLRWRSFRS